MWSIYSKQWWMYITVKHYWLPSHLHRSPQGKVRYKRWDLSRIIYFCSRAWSHKRVCNTLPKLASDMQGSGDVEQGENHNHATLSMQHRQCQQEPTCSVSRHKASTEVHQASSVRTSAFTQFSCDSSFSNCPDAIYFCLPWCDTTSSYTLQKEGFTVMLRHTSLTRQQRRGRMQHTGV